MVYLVASPKKPPILYDGCWRYLKFGDVRGMSNPIIANVYAALLGVALAVIGVYLMGYVAAIAVPATFYDWFANDKLAFYTVNFVSQFLAFGVLSLAVGVVLGHLSNRWFQHCLVCYLGYLFYLSAGSFWFYGGEIFNPFAELTFYDLPSMLLLPLCLTLSTYLTARKLTVNNFWFL